MRPGGEGSGRDPLQVRPGSAVSCLRGHSLQGSRDEHGQDMGDRVGRQLPRCHVSGDLSLNRRGDQQAPGRVPGAGVRGSGFVQQALDRAVRGGLFADRRGGEGAA